MRVRFLLPMAGLLAAALISGCSGSASGPPALSAPSAPQSVAFTDDGFVNSISDTTAAVGIRLTGESSGKSKYGMVLGYFKGTKSTISHVVTLSAGQSVVFHNVDSFDPHTGSFLGDASASKAPWPKSFNGSSTQSPANTDISTANFSTGSLNAGTSSLTYAANVPGFYMFGCFYHYNSFHMRDVIIVQ
jgi:plastocyanin